MNQMVQKLKYVAFLSILSVLVSCEKNHQKEVEIKLPNPTIGNGSIDQPAIGPAPAYNYGNDTVGFVLVKNWDFGFNGTITNMDSLTKHFQYHDQFGTIANGTNYGALTVAPDASSAVNNQPVEFVDTDRPVREMFDSTMKTYLVGLNGSTTVHPKNNKAGCGSFQAKWKLPKGGERLGLDLIWETRVRYKTPPYFWFALWTAGNKWDNGAEMDLIESFGFDNGGGYTNYDGSLWHSSIVGGSSETNYHSNWGAAMNKYGITDYDATQWHIWTWVYRADNTFSSYVDGINCQNGSVVWTTGGSPANDEIDMCFIFDASWGHKQISSVNHELDVSEFNDKFYEWDYSRVYLRDPSK